MNKNVILVTIIIVAIIIAGVMFSRNNDDQTVNETNETTTENVDGMGSDSMAPSESMETPMDNGSTMMESQDGKTKTFTIVGSNFKFSPNEMKVNKGDTVKVIFKSQGKSHNFVIDEFKVKTAELEEDKSEEVTFVADKTGTFEFYCSVGEHRSMGMKGSLIVQ